MGEVVEEVIDGRVPQVGQRTVVRQIGNTFTVPEIEDLEKKVEVVEDPSDPLTPRPSLSPRMFHSYSGTVRTY